MRLSIATAAAALALLGLASCASEYAYGPPGPYSDIDYMAYYDGYYGPFDGGYWGPRGYFYYSDHAAGRFHRDAARHFRREPAAGFHPIRGHAPLAASHGAHGPPHSGADRHRP